MVNRTVFAILSLMLFKSLPCRLIQAAFATNPAIICSEETITPNHVFNMGGNRIVAKTPDLNRDFCSIAAQPDEITGQYL